jgi:hypothetical protein
MSRIWKWKLKLSDFEFDIQHKEGRANANADALSRNPPEVCLPIRKREEVSPIHQSTPKKFELDTSTEDSPIFEAKPRSLSPFYDPRKRKKIFARKHFTIEEIPVKYFDQAAEITDEASIQETGDIETAREDESSSSCSELPQRQQEKTKPTITAELKISETRDSIAKINDHKVIFIDMKGNPVDRGALEIKDTGRLPHYEHLIFERAKLHQDLGKSIISLPVKENRNIPITTENLLNSLSSLLDVVNEKQMKSFGISKGNLEELPWRYIIKKLKEIFIANTLHIIICT